jgi:DNA polymerase-3 subunit alpha
MDEYKELWQKAVKINLRTPEHIPAGKCIIIGLIGSIKTYISKGGEMAFVNLTDYNGEIEMTFIPKVWERCRNHIAADKVAILQGRIGYQKNKAHWGFTVDDLLNRQEVDKTLEELEIQERRWEKYRTAWTYMAELKGGNLEDVEKGNYTILGFLKSLKEFSDKNGNNMAFGVVQDFEGEIDVVFFSRYWSQCRDMLQLDEFVALKGSIDPEKEADSKKPRFKVTSIADLAALTRTAARRAEAGEQPPQAKNAAAPQPAATPAHNASPDTQPHNAAGAGAVHIRLRAAAGDEELRILRDCLAKNTGSKPVFIYIPAPSGEKIIRASAGIDTIASGVIESLNNCGAVAQAWRE